jgi:hypothetical protein
MRCSISDFLKFVFAGTLSLCVLGCSTTYIEVTSRVEPDYRKPIQRAFIVSGLARISENYSSHAITNIAEQFTKARLTIDIYVESGLNLTSDDVAIQERVVAFSPDVILMLEPTEGSYVIPDRMTRAMVDASMYDWESKERVWRANIELESRNPNGPLAKRSAKALAKGLLNQFHKDGLLDADRSPEGIDA